MGGVGGEVWEERCGRRGVGGVGGEVWEVWEGACGPGQ